METARGALAPASIVGGNTMKSAWSSVASFVTAASNRARTSSNTALRPEMPCTPTGLDHAVPELDRVVVSRGHQSSLNTRSIDALLPEMRSFETMSAALSTSR